MTKIQNRFSGITIFEEEIQLKNLILKNKNNLSGTDLSEANLSEANLFGANLSGADLSETNLSEANLFGANLSGANLSEANLSEANLSGADLSGANLSEANLFGADLFGADLFGADLSETILDPNNIPNQKWENFKEDSENSEWIIGYRTKNTSSAGKILINDRIYGCEVFSTCEKTECHPGWYLWPTLTQAQNFSGRSTKFVRVKTRKIDLHKAGSKYRARMIWIIEDIK
jgi:hypothetical protein